MSLKMTVEEAKNFLMKECDDVIILSHDEGEGFWITCKKALDYRK